MSVCYRCLGCGNKTRFDVVTTRKTREFWHFTLGGERSIDETDVLDEVVESVTCRWCGKSSIEVIEEADAPATRAPDESPREATAPR